MIPNASTMTGFQPSFLAAKSRYGECMGKAVAFFAVYSIFYEIFGGLARYILINANALFVNNIPSVMAMLLFALYFVVTPLLNQKFEKFMIFFAVFLGICFVTFLLNDITAETAIFGFYVVAPFLLGTLVAVYGKEKTLFRYMALFWGCATVGVLINYFVKAPWVGLAYEVNGMQMAAAKEWYANGYERLAGFGRANYATAGVIVISCCYIISSEKYSKLVKLAVYLISALAIFLTTSKVELLALAVLPFYIFAYQHIKFLAPKSDFRATVCIGMIMFVAALVIILPLISSPTAFSGVSGTYMFISARSMIDRVSNTWPMNFRVLEDHGNYIFGRGIGGIGTPQIIMTRETPDKSTSDNLFLWVLLSGGFVAVAPMFWGLVRNLRSYFRQNPSYFYTLSILTFCMLVMGMTENLMEDTTFSLLIGFLVARGFIDRPIAQEAPP